MATAVISDVHGNLPALQAVLADIAAEGFDSIVSAGDLASGPLPAECIELLASSTIDVDYVMGNTDRGVIAAFDVRKAGMAPEDDRHPIDQFAARRITEMHRDMLAAFRPTVRIGNVLVCHGSPDSDEFVVTMKSPRERVQRAAEQTDASIIVGGHVHHQFTTPAGPGRIWVNAGSVGMPYEGAPGAYWLALTESGPEHRRSDYDVEAALELIESVDYPSLHELARILRGQISAEDAASAFEPA